MSRKLPGSAIVPGSITLTQITGSLNDTTNAAYAQANTARNTANDAYGQANAAYGQANNARSDANTTFATINTTFGTVNTSLGTINTNYQAAYAQANNARSDANTTFATVNTTFGTINTSLSTINSSFSTTNTNYQAAYAQANTARDTANNAYNNSNTKLSTSGGSISGDLSITGNLVVQGNATTINVSNLSVNDSIILLATGGTGDSTDIGFIGHFQRGATDTHAGLIRKATQNQFYLFDNYEVEPTNNVIDVAGNNFRVGNLRLGIINANSFVTAAGMDVTGQANAAYAQANAAYGQANSAYGAANNRVLKAGDTMTGNLIVSGATINTATANITTIVTGNSLTLSTGTASNANIVFSANGAEDMRITSEGAVLIGTTLVPMSHNLRVTKTRNDISGILLENPNTSTQAYSAVSYTTTGATTAFTGLAGSGKSTDGAIIADRAMFYSDGSAGIGIIADSGPIVFAAGSRAERARITTGGNVGIGTSSPTAKFEVFDTNRFQLTPNYGGLSGIPAGLLFASGNAANVAFIADASSGTANRGVSISAYSGTAWFRGLSYMNKSGTPDLLLQQDGGNVGIGTASPTTTLHVVGDVRFGAGSTGGSTAGNLYIAGNRLWRWIAGYSPDYGIGNGFGLYDDTGGAYRISVNTSGNVGIGTVNALTQLQVGYSTYTGGGPTDNFRVSSGSSTWISADRNGLFAYFGALDDGTVKFAGYNYSSANNVDMVLGQSSVYIKSSGNVGIGTASSAKKLHVYGDAKIGTGTSISGNALTINQGVNNQVNITHGSSTDWGLLLGFGDGSVSGNYHGANNAAIINVQNAPLHIGTNNTSRLLIDASGNMYLGLTGNPSGWGSAIKYAIRQASASGFTGFVSFASGNDNAIAVGHDGSVGLVGVSYATGSYTPLVFHVGGAERIRIDTAGNVGIGTTNPGSYKLQVQGDQYVSGTLTEASSITLKENIDPISNALDTISKLVGVTYDRKDGSAKNRAGLIAEEVDQVLPNVVNKDEEGNPTGIQYTNLIAYLVESIKELKAEIDVLKSK